MTVSVELETQNNNWSLIWSYILHKLMQNLEYVLLLSEIGKERLMSNEIKPKLVSN